MQTLTQTNGHMTNGRLTPFLRPVVASKWAYGQDRAFAMVGAAVATLARSGEAWEPLHAGGSAVAWAATVAELLANEEYNGVVLFCEDPAMAALVANKTPGVRAAAVSTVHQAARATLTIAANLLAVEMPGRTFFEIRHILQLLRESRLGCPAELASLLHEREHPCESSR
jgi:Ribose/Galactose Isomerase